MLFNEIKGLLGEVIEEDTYKIRDLHSGSRQENYHDRNFDFTPDVILDLGANIGVFTKYARRLYPDALIIAVEPDQDNLLMFKQFIKNDNKIILIEKGIGKGDLYHFKSASNGTGEVYISENSAFNRGYLKKSATKKIKNKSIMIPELKQFIKKGDQVLCKIDIEGNETKIFEDPDSMKLLRTFDYIAIELHCFGSSEKDVLNVKKLNQITFDQISKTHKTQYEHPMFYATKF